MRKSVVVYSECFQDGDLSSHHRQSTPQLKALAEHWLNETEIGKWLKEGDREVEIVIANDYATDQIKLHLVSKLTEKEHVEYILRWKN